MVVYCYVQAVMRRLQLRHQEIHQRRLDEGNTSGEKANLNGNSKRWGLGDLLESGWLVLGSHGDGGEERKCFA